VFVHHNRLRGDEEWMTAVGCILHGFKGRKSDRRVPGSALVTLHSPHENIETSDHVVRRTCRMFPQNQIETYVKLC